MYSLSRQFGWKKLLVAEGPWLGTSLIIAELFYKFHSFTLECLAFLGTWLAISYVSSLVVRPGSAKQQ